MFARSRFASCAVSAALLFALGCGDNGEGPAPDSGSASASALYVNEYLASIELTLIRGRTLGRISIDAKDADARAALIAFGEAVAAKIPQDGSAPKTLDALKALVPASGEIAGWQESAEEPTDGPWSYTSATDWINGGSAPFDNNGFVAAAGEAYVKSGSEWQIQLELVLMGSVSGAEAALVAADWNAGEKL